MAAAPALPADRPGSPHQMVSRLLDGAIRRLGLARAEIPSGRSDSLAAAVAIIEALQDSLDMAQGGQLAGNLFDLYDYMLRRLAHAHGTDDPAPLAEVSGLLDTIREGWDAISPEV